MTVWAIIGYLLLGAAIGAFGTLIGAGGGFILTPVLLLLFPHLPAENVTAVSMTTVFFNSGSGSFAYAWMKRIDYKTGFIFAAATLPGVVTGTLLTAAVPRKTFTIIFGVFMLVFAGVILLKSRMGDRCAAYDCPGKFRARRRLTDREGNQTSFSFPLPPGVLISVGVGFLSGFLGIGGGIVHVPALVFLGFPAHFATATSHFVLAWSSLTSFAIHLAAHTLSGEMPMAFTIAAGAVAGAQIGARVSKSVKGRAIMVCLAIALCLAGVRVIAAGFSAENNLEVPFKPVLNEYFVE